MPHYDCEALDATGLTLRLEIVADSRAKACQKLDARGLFAVDVTALEHGSREQRSTSAARRAFKPREMEFFATELSALVGASISLDAALAFVGDEAPSPAVAGVAGDLRENVRAGESLSDALAAHPARFSAFFVGLVAAGEASGRLDAALAEVARHLGEQRRLVADVRGKLTYPAFLAGGSLLSLLLLSTVVFPAFGSLLSQSGARPPALTQAIVDAGTFLRAFGLHILAGLGVAVLVLVHILRTPRAKGSLWRRLYTAPMLGPVLADLTAAQFANALSSLLHGGVRLVDALQLAGDMVGNPVARDAVARTRLAVRDGERLTDALQSEQIFPRRLIHILRVGEEGGQLDAMAARAAGFHAEQARRRIAASVALINPVTTLVMGVLIALMVGSLMSALLNLNPGGL